MRIGHLASERTLNLDPSSPKSVWEGKEEKEREKPTERERINFRVRSSHFFLDFPMIGLSNLDEPRGKVDPHYKSYAWVPVLWSFKKI